MGFNEDKSLGKGKGSTSTKVLDKRFDTSKPQFRKPKSKDAKIELDDRFKSVLTDPKFQLQTLNKYGRKQSNANDRQNEELSEFYTVGSNENDGTYGHRQRHANSDERFQLNDKDLTNNLRKANQKDNEDHDKKNPDPVSRIAYLNALSRGEVELSSSDEDEGNDDDSDDDDDDDIYNREQGIEQGISGVLDPSYIEDITAVVDFTTNASPYLAVMNADWSHFRAVDIFAIISSFVPSDSILRVSVYPSNFGFERLKKEELFGPVDVWRESRRSKNGESDSEDEYPGEGSEPDENDDDHENKFETTDITNATGTDDNITSDFDPEKLRIYEASRLKYFFAVVEFANPQYTDIAYKEVDGMEFEHSSAALDLRIIPVDEIESVIENRKLRDEAMSVPSNYNPPDFVVNALQQSAVQCTWDAGDRNREVLLTKYNVSGQTWGQVSDADDVKAYLASDQSSDDEGSVRDNKKSNRLRLMLGIDSDDDEKDDKAEESNSEEENSSQSDDEGEYGLQASYVPGKLNNSVSYATTSEEKQDKEMTPWEKYLEKRQQKKREKRAAVRDKRKQVSEERKKGTSKKKDVKIDDEFFVDHDHDGDMDADGSAQFVAKDSDGESGLVNEREGDDLDKRDFDIRGVQRLEKNKDKILTGARKRKEERLTGNVGSDFRVDIADERFKAVLEGTDERFGIDRTDPNFKETPAMKQILSEQTRHRMKKRKLNNAGATKFSTSTSRNSDDIEAKPTAVSVALGALVSSVKSKVMR